MNYLLSGTQTKRLLFRKFNGQTLMHGLSFTKTPVLLFTGCGTKKIPRQNASSGTKNNLTGMPTTKEGMNALIEKDTGKLVGHCGLLVQTVDGQAELEIGYSLLPAFWNKGYATEAAAHCRDYAFQQELSESLISIISLSNTPSQRVAIKNGMYVDKQTTYAGNAVKIFRITKADWEARGR